MIRSVRKIAPETICVVEGGPIVRPEEMDEVCRAAHAQTVISAVPRSIACRWKPPSKS